MIQILKNTTTAVGFVTMVCLQIYFVLLLLAKPALATDAEVNQPPAKTVTTATETKAVVEGEDEINIKLDLKNGLTVKGLADVVKKLEALDKKKNDGSIKIDNNGIQITGMTDDEGEAGDDGQSVTPYPVRMARGSMKDFADSILFLCAFGFAAYFVYSKNRTRREYLETIKVLAQSGQPIPPELINSMNSKNSSGKLLSPGQTSYDASAIQGIKYIFLGIGFCGFMILISEGHVAYAIGFLFIVIGAFHIYTSQLVQKQKTTDVAATTTPENK